MIKTLNFSLEKLSKLKKRIFNILILKIFGQKTHIKINTFWLYSLTLLKTLEEISF